MNEASKTRALWGAKEREWLKGNGLDIGCGPDPILPGVRTFDVGDGDANEILKRVSGPFDFVFSSHCLEHMREPEDALGQWWQLVRPGGHLVVIVPDEDLYEQGYFPSIFNPDHKATFTIGKRTSWSPRSIDLLALARQLDGAEVVAIELQDAGYDRSLLVHAPYPAAVARLAHRARHRLSGFARRAGIPFNGRRIFQWLRLPVDQTMEDAVAQIQVVVRKGVAIS
jgi:SAM-dependent methyltransferase